MVHEEDILGVQLNGARDSLPVLRAGEIAVYYYFRIIVAMWITEARDEVPYDWSPTQIATIAIANTRTLYHLKEELRLIDHEQQKKYEQGARH